MRPANYIPSPSLVLSVFGVTLLASPALAQDKPADNSKPADNAKPADSDKSTDKPADKPTDKPADDAKPDDKSSSSSASAAKATQSVETGIPSLTGGNNGPNGLPTLTGNPAIPTYPPPAIPPTKDAPFMQRSSAPEGTVFIAVGAILGAFGVAILLWRAIVSLLLHRSVERAAAAQNKTKSGFPAPPAPFYKYSDQDSSAGLSGSNNARTGRGVRRTNRGNVPSTNASQSNLFFSPTAAATGNGAGNRASTFLPSGFYAAGSSSPGPQQQGNSIGMSNLAPDARGNYVDVSRASFAGSPPDTPPFDPRHDLSTSSVNLSAPLQPGQRAPSAYLDDLLADDPSTLPPPGMSPQSGRRSSRH